MLVLGGFPLRQLGEASFLPLERDPAGVSGGIGFRS